MRKRLPHLCALACLAAGLTGCLGALALDDFVDLDDRDGRVPAGPLATLEAGFVGLPPTHVDTMFLDRCTGVSADRTRLVTGGDRVRIWDTDSGDLVAVAGAASDTLDTRALCAADDAVSVVAATDAGRVRILDTATGAVRSEVALPDIVSVDVAPDASRIAVAARDGVFLFDAASGAPLARLDAATDQVRGLRFAPDSARLAVLDRRDDTVAVFALHGLDAVGRVPHERYPLDASLRGRALVWRDDDTLAVASKAGERCEVVARRLSSGLTLESTGDDALCDELDRPPLVPWTDEHHAWLFYAEPPDGPGPRLSPEGLAWITDTGVGAAPEVVWQRSVGRPVDAIAFFDDAPNLLTRSTDGTIRTWNPVPDANDDELLDTKDDSRPDAPMALTRDARQAVYGPSREALEEDPDAGPDAPRVSTIAVSGASGGSGTGAMVVNQNGTLIAKSLVTGRTLARFTPRPAPTDDDAVSANPPGGVGATGAVAIDESADWIAAQWRGLDGREGVAVLDVGERRRTFELYDAGPATALTFVDGSTWVSAHRDGRLVLRTATAAKSLDELSIGSVITALAATATEGEVIAAGLGDGRLVLWAPDSGNTRVIEAHARPITAVRFSTHGDLVATADAGGLVQIWSAHLAGGPELTTPLPPAELIELAPVEAHPVDAETAAARLGRAVGQRM